MTKSTLVNWEQVAIARRIYEHFHEKFEHCSSEIYFCSGDVDLQLLSIVQQMFPYIFIFESKILKEQLDALGMILKVLDPTE